MPLTRTHTPDDVRAYYDANTGSFLSTGEGAQAIRRAVWAPGVTDKSGAFSYLDREILRELVSTTKSGDRARLVDLGCGVGASLRWLVQQGDFEGVGVTISPFQAHFAQQAAEAGKLGSRLRFLEASFTALPPGLGVFDLAFSIEAFVHSPEPAAYLSEATRHLRKGGKLIIIDDFLTERGAAPLPAKQARWLDEFRHGWLASSLITPAECARLAASFSLKLVRNDDLTPYLELKRPRDYLIAALLAVTKRLPIRSYLWRSWLGGNGLQNGLMAGLINYRLLVFERG